MGCMLSLIIEAALVAEFVPSTNYAALQAAVAMFFIFQVFYGMCLDGTQFSYLGEIFPTHLRAKGMCLGVAMISLMNIIWLQSAPTAFVKIGWKFYLCFIIPGTIGAVIMVRIESRCAFWRNDGLTQPSGSSSQTLMASLSKNVQPSLEMQMRLQSIRETSISILRRILSVVIGFPLAIAKGWKPGMLSRIRRRQARRAMIRCLSKYHKLGFRAHLRAIRFSR